MATISADVTGQAATHRILGEVHPDVLVLNAGTPRMGRLDEISWANFTAPREIDVRGGLYWLQAALTLPLEPATSLPHPASLATLFREREGV